MAIRTSQWVVGTAGAGRWPTDGAGAATGTATSSQLHNCLEVEVIGISVSAAAAGVAGACDSAATLIPGLTVDGNISGWKEFPPGVRYSHATNANVGILCGAGVTATLFYRKIR